MSQPPLILASSSVYRRALLARLGLPFETMSPEIDESARLDESPLQLVQRLSAAKADKIAASATGATVIGSDQAAILDSTQLSKPGTQAKALAQLRKMRGRHVDFHTGLCVLAGENGEKQQAIVSYRVKFRDFSEGEIERYLRAARPYDCAASLRSEALGISLIERMEGPDPSALTGLPLLRLCEMLRNLGYNLP